METMQRQLSRNLYGFFKSCVEHDDDKAGGSVNGEFSLENVNCLKREGDISIPIMTPRKRQFWLSVMLQPGLLSLPAWAAEESHR